MRSAAMAASFPDILEGYQALVVGFAERYSELKRERSALDFDDLQERAVGLLGANPEIAQRYRKHFRMVMIDEFQDTNELQLRVITPLRTTTCASWGTSASPSTASDTRTSRCSSGFARRCRRRSS